MQCKCRIFFTHDYHLHDPKQPHDALLLFLYRPSLLITLPPSDCNQRRTWFNQNHHWVNNVSTSLINAPHFASLFPGHSFQWDRTLNEHNVMDTDNHAPLAMDTLLESENLTEYPSSYYLGSERDPSDNQLQKFCGTVLNYLSCSQSHLAVLTALSNPPT